MCLLPSEWQVTVLSSLILGPLCLPRMQEVEAGGRREERWRGEGQLRFGGWGPLSKANGEESRALSHRTEASKQGERT